MENLRFNCNLLRLAILALFPLMVACNNDDDNNNNPGGNTASEALIFSEGAFGQDNGSLTRYDIVGQAATQALFESTNGQKFGGSLNSAYAHDGRIFVTVQTSGGANDKVVVLDATDYTKIAEITNSAETDIVIPSQTLVIGSTLFLSCWGAYDDNFNSPDSYVLAFDASDYSFKHRVEVPSRANILREHNGQLLVSQAGSSTVTLFNPEESNPIVSTVELGQGATGFVPTSGGFIVGVTGSFTEPSMTIGKFNGSFFEPYWDGQGEYFDYSLGSRMALSRDKSTLFFVLNEAWPGTDSKLMALDLNAKTATELEVNELQSVYSLSVSPTGELFLGIAPDFTNTGTGLHLEYSNEAVTEINAFQTGIAPRSFVFN